MTNRSNWSSADRVASARDTSRRMLGGVLRRVAAGARWGAQLIDNQDNQRGGAPGGLPRLSGPMHRRARRVHYVPTEMCVVVSASSIDNPRGLYAALWTSLNDSLVTLVKQTAGGRDRQRTPFEQDMAPDVLTRLLQQPGTERLIGPLERQQDPSARDMPFVLLPPGKEGRPAMLAFCQAGRSDAPDPDQIETVREAVNLVNGNLDRVNRDLAVFLQGAPDGQGVATAPRIEAVTPNWLMAGTQEDFTEAGPGAAPGPVDPATMAGAGRWTFQFDQAAHHATSLPSLADLVETQRQRARDDEAPGQRSGVLVAILDTCPTKDMVAGAARRYTDNLLLADVANPANVSIDEPPSLSGAQLEATLASARGPFVANWRRLLGIPGARHEHFQMVDHGLFAAGIVRDIAPTAEIRVIRVLDDYGVGDLLSLARVLGQLPDLLRTTGRRRLIVNLSLVADLPPDDLLLDFWLPNTARNPEVLRRRLSDVCRVMTTIHQSLNRVVTLNGSQAEALLVVAAAGNDHVAARARPAPRLPARYDQVLGVAAVNSRGAPASYTNKGDFVILGNGVATFGGDATDGRPGSVPQSERVAGQPVDAIAGIFRQSDYPLQTPPGTNTTGWAYWAGTSFATPVISGIAADIWASDAGAGLTPAQLIEAVRAYSTALNADLDCPYIPASQRYVNR